MRTNFRLKAQDSSVVIGRTMEFPDLMGAKITVLRGGFAGAGIAPSGTGKTWTSEYGVVGVDAFGQPGWLTDGMNERGVYAGLLYMPGFCDYPAADGRDPATCMSIVNAIGLSKMTISPSRHSMTAEAPPASCSMRCEEGAFPKPLTVHGHTVTADMSDPRAWFDF